MQVNVANNFMGHGFWQLSPEMVFRVFSAANGYEIEAVLLHEVVPHGGWWAVTDPHEAGSRVELSNSAPTYILTVAKRIARADIFARAPQQSDWVAAWERVAGTGVPASNPGGATLQAHPAGLGYFRHALRCALQHLPLSKALFALGNAFGSPFRRPYYRRLSEDDVLRGNLTPGHSRSTGPAGRSASC